MLLKETHQHMAHRCRVIANRNRKNQKVEVGFLVRVKIEMVHKTLAKS